MFVPQVDFRSVAKPNELTKLGWFEIGMHAFASRDEALVANSSVCLSWFNISLHPPYECQEEVGGWESFPHGINKAIGIFGFFECFFKN